MTKLSQIRKTTAKVQRDKYRQSTDCLYFLYVYRLYNDVIGERRFKYISYIF